MVAKSCEVIVDAQPMGGGLEAAAVHLITVSTRDGSRPHCYVRKVAHGVSAREADVYRGFLRSRRVSFAPRLLGLERVSARTAVLCLEAVQPQRPWPWGDAASTCAVLERVAVLHAIRDPGPLPAWDYDAELAASAAATVSVIRRLASRAMTSGLVRNSVRAVEELAEALRLIRAELRASSTFHRCLIHGDLHPGNVIERGHADPVLIDWARARLGSPLEDVSSWLQSLAYWEPEVRRRHDTLLVRYLAVRGFPSQLTSEIRDLYWMAAACNALSGALLYHLSVASESQDPAARNRSAHAARDWIRILRRARASLR
jgi:hypothetical protein